jgi:ADP-ribosylation factor-like protein 5B
LQELKGALLLIFANKQDVKGAMSSREVSQALGLSSVKDHTWHIQPCCALTGEGLYTGMDWVSAHVASMS